MMQSNEHLSAEDRKKFTEESKWSEESPTESKETELFSFLCSVKCKKSVDDDGRRLAVITRLSARAIDEHIHISEAWNIEDNPIEPAPENLEAWLQHAYPKVENGNSIRHQIDKTIKSEEQFVADIKSGKICKLAAQAFQTHTKFNPPPWAEKLKLQLKEQAGPARSGPRIKCPLFIYATIYKIFMKTCISDYS